MKIANFIAWILLLIGGINWLMMGIFSVNVIGMMFGSMSIVARILYCLVGLAAIWLIISPIMFNGRVSLWGEDDSTISTRRKSI